MAELTPEQLKEQIRLAKVAADAITGAETAQGRLASRALDTLATYEQQNAALSTQAHSTQKVIAQQEIALGIAREELNLLRAFPDATEDAVAAAARLVDQLEKGTTALKEGVSAAKQLGTSLSGAFRLSGVSNFSEKITGVVTALRGGTTSAGEFLNTLSTGLLTAAIDNIAGLVIKLIDTESAFRKSTGASKEYARSVTRTYEATRQYGVSAEEASSATMALYRSFTDFSLSSARVRGELAKTAATMAELGVSNESFAQTTQMATKMLGVSASQMRNVTTEIATYAQNMNMDVGQMFQQLGQAGPQLAKYGNQGIDTFKRLQHVFKITGLEMNKVLQITSRFDTFEGAARQAGMLNAALGSNMVNAMELMQETDPVGRFQILRNAILDTGLTFDRMSYYQKNFYKDALGLSDVGDLAMMLSGDMKNLAGVTQKNSKEWEKFKNQAASVQGLMDLFKATIAAMVPVLTPVMKTVKGFFVYLNSDGGTALRGIIGGLITAKLAWMSLGFVTGGATAKLTAWIGKIIAATVASKAAAGGIAIVGSSLATVLATLAPLTPVLGALAGTFLLIGVAVGAAAYALSRLSNVFGNMYDVLVQIVPAATGLNTMFSIMGNQAIFDTAVAGLKRVKAELTDMPEGTIQLTQAMHSVATAAHAADQSAALINMISQLSAGGVGGGGAGGGASQHTIDLRFDTALFENKVVNIIGDRAAVVNRQKSKK
jgi:hypothetical protein